MKHFSDASWADFVRNLVSPDTRMAMQQHIDDGCSRCQTSLQTWQSVISVAKGENDYTPPDDVVRVAKSQFAAATLAASPGIRLLFDSLLQPVTAGVRGLVSTRQLLYETDELYIDLRLEPQRELNRVCLVGQVLNRGKQGRAEQGLPVRLKEGTLPVTHTTTNQFGEFQLEFKASKALFVLIGRDEENAIVLPLYGVQSKVQESQDLRSSE